MEAGFVLSAKITTSVEELSATDAVKQNLRVISMESLSTCSRKIHLTMGTILMSRLL